MFYFGCYALLAARLGYYFVLASFIFKSYIHAVTHHRSEEIIERTIIYLKKSLNEQNNLSTLLRLEESIDRVLLVVLESLQGESYTQESASHSGVCGFIRWTACCEGKFYNVYDHDMIH